LLAEDGFLVDAGAGDLWLWGDNVPHPATEEAWGEALADLDMEDCGKREIWLAEDPLGRKLHFAGDLTAQAAAEFRLRVDTVTRVCRAIVDQVGDDELP